MSKRSRCLTDRQAKQFMERLRRATPEELERCREWFRLQQSREEWESQVVTRNRLDRREP
jgi:hypothetical protein